jgi:anti-sigma B factor antagonist
MISVEVGTDILIMIEVNELNIENVKFFQEKISSFAMEHKKNILINMEKVNYIDSAGISMLVRLIQRYSSKKRKVEFKNITTEVRNAIKVVNLHRFFKIM